MHKISAFIAKLEERAEQKLGRVLSRYKEKFVVYIPLALIVWYFYGMFINSIHLGIRSTFNTTGDEIGSIWVANPFKNLLAVFTTTGLATTGICVIFLCLTTKKGIMWLSGYQYTRDSRGFDILPDSTHGSSGFMTKKEMERIVTLDSIEKTEGTIIGKLKDHPHDKNKYAKYLAIKKNSGLADHTIVFGATGSGKSRGYVTPFILQALRRKESIIIVDPKGELYERTSEYLRSEQGYTTKIFNLLDPENSDGWNPFDDIEFNSNLVDSIAEVIIKNTSNVSERQDFWEKAEKNLLVALMHYIQSQKIPGTNRLLPIEQRSLGAIYRLLSDESFAELEGRFADLDKEHPAKAPYGIFKLANRQIWGNIAIGLGNRLSVFQNMMIDKITAHNDIDLTLPGKQPCAYYCVISAQDSQYEFLSSLFFSCMFSRLTDYARREGIQGRLPVTVNFLLEEFCNIGKLVDFKKQLAVLRGFNINCQIIVQSAAGLADRYEKKEWEEIISHCDTTICLGVNDLMTASYMSDKCGAVTIRVENNQRPVTFLLSPMHSSTHQYKQTRSNTQRKLMMPDEIMRMDNKKCLVLLRGQKPMLLDKVIPEEFPAFAKLRYTKITNYVPKWRMEPLPPGSDDAQQMQMESAKDTKPKNETPLAQEQGGTMRTNSAGQLSWNSGLEYSVSNNDDSSSTGQESETPSCQEGKYGGFGTLEVSPDMIKQISKT